ncbi:ABC transporter substrate-binding protein [Caenimonas terrae]|uniref:ABC transporter substrate-binding protein n=1 Tax=Caenimonas terrae TaxID=696074 RepID=A0ABW0NA75_9BURK
MKTWSIALLVTSVLLSSCSDWEGQPRKARAQRAESATGDIVVGVVWPTDGPKADLWQGIDLATREINAAGGVLGRKLRIVKADDAGSLAKGRLVAQEFADNHDMVAVIGHLYSFISLPASAIYQAGGLVYITPGATAYKINSQGFDLVFRSIASNRNLGIQLADYMYGKGYRRVAMLYEKTTNTQSLANYFEQHARDLGITIVDRRRYLQGSEDFTGQISSWKDLYAIDAIFLAARLQEGSSFISQARRLGLSQPVVSGEGLDSPAILTNKDAQGVVVPEEISAAGKAGAPYKHFVGLYEGAYHKLPGTYPVVGYDALYLLANSMRTANSTVPDKVAAALHATKGWQGAAGSFTFDATGDIPDKKIGVKKVDHGRFVDLSCGPDMRCDADAAAVPDARPAGKAP